MKEGFLRLMSLGVVACVAASCAAPRASVVNEPEKKPSLEALSAGGSVPQSGFRGVLDDGYRLPSMTEMPDDSELRSVRPVSQGTANGGVIVRPPSDDVPVPE